MFGWKHSSVTVGPTWLPIRTSRSSRSKSSRRKQTPSILRMAVCSKKFPLLRIENQPFVLVSYRQRCFSLNHFIEAVAGHVRRNRCGGDNRPLRRKRLPHLAILGTRSVEDTPTTIGVVAEEIAHIQTPADAPLPWKCAKAALITNLHSPGQSVAKRARDCGRHGLNLDWHEIRFDPDFMTTKRPRIGQKRIDHPSRLHSSIRGPAPRAFYHLSRERKPFHQKCGRTHLRRPVT